MLYKYKILKPLLNTYPLSGVLVEVSCFTSVVFLTASSVFIVPDGILSWLPI
jgi:hypothetical protein